MRRVIVLLPWCFAPVACCGDGERLTVPPLPQDGTALSFAQVVNRLAAQTNAAKEEHFLNHWESLAEATTALEQSRGYLLKAPDLPATHKTVIETASTRLGTDIAKLREAARRKDQTESLEMIRLIHNQIRDLQELK